MILKQKKKLMYLLSLTFGLVLTIFAVSKDNQSDHELVDSFTLPVAHADTPTPPGSDGTTGGTTWGGGGGDDDAGSDGGGEG